ncbi:hypothetical protein, partial [Enterobacter wuhouensis]|uniref:hypothetical protein n=1 Tax=Enterobacter wuhouensis TaxID=2529381 RepID=UPI001A9547F4
KSSVRKLNKTRQMFGYFLWGYTNSHLLFEKIIFTNRLRLFLLQPLALVDHLVAARLFMTLMRRMPTPGKHP